MREAGSEASEELLTRERARRFHDSNQHLIDRLTFANNMAELDCVRRRGGRFPGTPAHRHEAAIRNHECLWTGDPNDRQSALPNRRSYGCYRVIEHSKKLSHMTAIARGIFGILAFEEKPRFLITFLVQIV